MYNRLHAPLVDTVASCQVRPDLARACSLHPDGLVLAACLLRAPMARSETVYSGHSRTRQIVSELQILWLGNA